MRLSSYTVDILLLLLLPQQTAVHTCPNPSSSSSSSYHVTISILTPPSLSPSLFLKRSMAPVVLHSHSRSPSAGSLAMPQYGGEATSKKPASWVENFTDFSWARRGDRRRSMSDSFAFLETQVVVEEEGGGGVKKEEEGVALIEAASDEFSSIFHTTATTTTTAAAASSVTNMSENNKRGMKVVEEQEEVESSSSRRPSFSSLPPPSSSSLLHSTTETIADPKRVKRILANRQSAQRSRVRKLQYISELERSVTSLQTEVSVLSPRVAYLDNQRLLLNVDNTALKQRIAALVQDQIFNDAHEEALRREIERLQQVYNNQKLKKIAPSGEEEPDS